jgi:hypothetical protein
MFYYFYSIHYVLLLSRFIKLQFTFAKIHALKGIDPQVGMLLLRLCCMPLLNYLAQVTPPSLTAQHFAESDFDIQVADFVLQLLTLTGRASCPPCAEDRMRAFRRRLRLPMRHNGAGLVGVDSIATAAFAGSVIAATHADRVLPLHLDGLARFAQPAVRTAGPPRPPRRPGLQLPAQAAQPRVLSRPFSLRGTIF